MDLTDAMRRVLFEQTFGLTKSDAGAKAALLRRVGVPEDQIAGFCRPGIHAGMALGGAHAIDVRWWSNTFCCDSRPGPSRCGWHTTRTI